jgi:acyl-coenzyme A thioesterase PaaI-like protein
MTNCLFAHGIVAVTAEMTVRFRHPIKTGVPVIARARIARSQRLLHVPS